MPASLAAAAAPDLAVVNVPLSQRGNINAQLDRFKRHQRKAAAQETIEPNRLGVPHLCKGGMTRTFANWKQAEAAAQRTGGVAYQSPLSRRFCVHFPVQA